jgi:casein kinase II subunit beta
MESDDDDDDDDEVDAKKTREDNDLADQAALVLYQLIHARFLQSQRGIQIMANKFKNGEFGQCPRLFCEGQNVLPVGKLI